MKLIPLLSILLFSTFCSFSQDSFVLYDEQKDALTLYFKDGRTFAIANKAYEAYPFQWWDAGPKDGGGFHNIRNMRYNKCLYFDARSKTVEATSCQETDVQKWKIEEGILVNKYSQQGLKLTNSGSMSVEKENATQFTQMYLEEVNSSSVKITTRQENMGEHINTIYPEVLPVISGDGKHLFFMRKELTEDKKITTNIYTSQRVSTTRWSAAEKMPAPLNNNGKNYVCSSSADGATLLLGNEYHQDGSVSQGISITRFKNGKWTFPVPVKIDDFDNFSSKAEYSLSFDNQVLMLAVESNESIGQRDLFVSFRKKDNTFSKPLNLGNKLNTPFQEDAPFLSADKRTLFFSSNGLPGYGRHDIFMAHRLDTSWTNWTEPINLGRPINSADWEAYFSIDSQQDYAYVVAENNKTIGRSDIFRIKLPDNFVGDPVCLFKGKTVDGQTGTPINANVKMYEINTDEKEVDVQTEGENFETYLLYDKTYAVFVEADGYIPFTDRITIKDRSIGVIENEFKLNKMADQGTSVLIIKNILFDYDDFKLTPAGRRELNLVYDFMKDVPAMKLEIRGHTDNNGTEEYNQELSEKRAEAVYNYYIEKGISNTRLSFKGMGEKEPIASNESEEGKAKNRRVEFVFLKE